MPTSALANSSANNLYPEIYAAAACQSFILLVSLLTASLTRLIFAFDLDFAKGYERSSWPSSEALLPIALALSSGSPVY